MKSHTGYSLSLYSRLKYKEEQSVKSFIAPVNKVIANGQSKPSPELQGP